MFEHGTLDDKPDDAPDPRDLTPCGEMELRTDKTAEDGLNSSLSLERGHLRAVGADQGDPILVYVEANGKWVAYDRKTYGSRPGVGLPKKARDALDLNAEDTIKVWIGSWEAKSGEDEAANQASSERTHRQQALHDEQVAQDNFVWLLEDGPSTTYHHIRHDDGAVTVCGINFGDKDYRTLSDPGDALDECEQCERRSAGDMTNRELVDWIADEDRADFSVDDDDGAPAYLSKSELLAIRHYILDLEEAVEELREGTEDLETVGFT